MDFRSSRIQGLPLDICLAETSANVKNRYTGIFTIDGDTVRFHMVVFDTGMRTYFKNGRGGLIVDLITDDAEESGESEIYEWTGMIFYISRIDLFRHLINRSFAQGIRVPNSVIKFEPIGMQVITPDVSAPLSLQLQMQHLE
jgi:hypothetical protein